MAVPINNAGLKSIQTEFGGDTTDGGISLSEYYKGGTYVPIGQLPSSYSIGIVPVEPNYYWSDPVNPPPEPFYDTISIGNFLGMEKMLVVDITISQNLLSGFNLHSYITTNYPNWTSAVKIKATVTINAGVYVIGENTNNDTYGFDATFNFATGSTLKIINNGVISGRGGNGGTGGRYPNISPTAGGVGGKGLNVSGIETTIQNQGMIAGGGGGGAGGASAVTISWLPNSGDGGGVYGGFAHWSGSGGGGGVPLGVGGAAGATCGELTDADLASIGTTRDVEGGYYWGTKFWVAPFAQAGTTATLSNRGVGHYPQVGGDSFFGDPNYTAGWHSADGADYGMDGLVGGNITNGARDPASNLISVFATESAKFGGQRGKAIVGGNKIIWLKYGVIRGDVDDWGYWITKNGQPQILRDHMRTPAFFTSETRKIPGWGTYWDSTYYTADSPISNGTSYPAPNGNKTYRTFLTLTENTTVILQGLCDDNLLSIKVNGVPINYSTFATTGGGWNVTNNKRFSFEYEYKTSGFNVPAGVSVIEIEITHTNYTPHMCNIAVKNMYNSILVTPKQWFYG